MSRKLRIVGVTRAWKTHASASGMEVHAANLYEGLASRGHEVHVITTINESRIDQQTVENDVVVHYVQSDEPGRNSTRFKDEMRRVFQELTESGTVNLIHSESIAGDAIVGSDVPSAVTWHGVGFCALMDKYNEAQIQINQGHSISQELAERIQSGASKVLDEMRAFRAFDHHVAISDQASTDLKNVYGIPDSRVNIVYNGFDVGRFGKNSIVRKSFRSKLNYSDDTVVIGLTGRIVPSKGHRNFMEVISSLLERYDNLRVLVVGGGGLVKEYQRKLGGRVDALGKVSYGDMAGYYNAMDIFTNPTWHYLGLDSTTIEAMLCGLAVCVSDVGSVRRTLVEHEVNGLLFPVADQTAYAEQLSELINDPTKRSILGDNAMKSARGRFSVEKMCNDMEELFLRIAN